MTVIIRSDLIISGTYKLTDTTQVASGVKITVLPGATLDLGNFSLLNYGTLSLEGDATKFAVVQNGTYILGEASSLFKSNYGNLKSVGLNGSYSSNGTLQITNSLIENSKIEAVFSTSISKSIFKSSPLVFGTESGTVDQVTFSDSKVAADVVALYFRDMLNNPTIKRKYGNKDHNDFSNLENATKAVSNANAGPATNIDKGIPREGTQKALAFARNLDLDNLKKA